MGRQLWNGIAVQKTKTTHNSKSLKLNILSSDHPPQTAQRDYTCLEMSLDHTALVKNAKLLGFIIQDNFSVEMLAIAYGHFAAR